MGLITKGLCIRLMNRGVRHVKKEYMHLHVTGGFYSIIFEFVFSSNSVLARVCGKEVQETCS